MPSRGRADWYLRKDGLLTMTHKKSFTLMELLVVISIIALLLPNYTKSLRKAHERDANIQLTSIHSANLIFHAQSGEFLPTGAGDISQINAGLNLGIIANDITYTYTIGATTDQYTATAAWGGFTLKLDETGTICCQPNGCPSIPDC